MSNTPKAGKDLINAFASRIRVQCQADAARDREILAGVIAQKDAELAKVKQLALAFSEIITNIAVGVLGLSDPNLGGDCADWVSDKTLSESVIESFTALRNQAEQDKAEIKRLRARL